MNERENFIRYIGVVLRLHPAPMEGMRALVLERIAVHAVDTEDSNPARLAVRTESADHALAFHFPFIAAARWKREDRRSIIAVNGDAHVPVEAVREPNLMVAMHGVRA